MTLIYEFLRTILRMRSALTRLTITVGLFFVAGYAPRACAQDANDPGQLQADVADSEDDALVGVGQDLGDLGDKSEKAIKNEFKKDVTQLNELANMPTPSLVSTTSNTPAMDDSLKEIERDVDSLEAQSKALSQ